MTEIVVQINGMLYSAIQTRATDQPQSASAIQKATEQLQADLVANLQLPALARELGVSYSWLRRAFAKHTGLSPHQYQLELRLARARDLLSHIAISIKEIAYQLSFEDEHYFCRL